jgi:solute carrier family 8 (sodium/calcium exchanger)
MKPIAIKEHPKHNQPPAIWAGGTAANITGSNSVNVFLGLGIPWVVATIYKYCKYDANDKRSKFIITDTSMPFAIALYSIAAIITLLLLTFRRYSVAAGKAELGGHKTPKMVSTMVCVSLWLVYIICASLQAYDFISF